jgi:hypothetical protein
MVVAAGEGDSQEMMVAGLGAARGWRRGDGQERRWPRAAPKKVVVARAASRRGAANPRVSAVERSSSDYHVSGEGLPRKWMVVLSHEGYNI